MSDEKNIMAALGLSLSPTSAAPAPTACDRCGVACEPIWSGRVWLPVGRCQACIKGEERRRIERELLAVWEPALLEQVGLLHYEQEPDALLSELVEFGRRGATRAQSAIYLHGPVGTGKTQQLVWMGRRVVRYLAARGEGQTDCPVVYVRLPTMLTALRADERPLAHFQRAPWLMLDELAAEELTPWAQSQLTEVIEHRLRWRLPTVYASNVSLRQLSELGARGWDERITSRIVQQVGQDEDSGGLIGHYKMAGQLRVKGVR